MSDAAVSSSSIAPPPSEVVVHPLVLLSVVDHFNRCDEVRVNARERDELKGMRTTSTRDCVRSDREHRSIGCCVAMRGEESVWVVANDWTRETEAR